MSTVVVIKKIAHSYISWILSYAYTTKLPLVNAASLLYSVHKVTKYLKRLTVIQTNQHAFPRVTVF